ncbi:conjugal transfer protein [Pandoraea cepalis]|uniref:Conjugal transfer protein n=1 Tax=Pandoraea cepalis TaxID=2508294 RepID=A0AAW7MGK0_9BURK|nr:conjugal transfer protein TraF [Pandoraea cepalis]MDN4571873.1 conjugal transfer protein [Pandoraea cepalis]MDN4581327.1 conjugal transfer protein [Pandoraea cepalis]
MPATQPPVPALLLALAVASVPAGTLAQQYTARGDDYGNAFVNYQPYVVPGQPEATDEKVPPLVPAAPAPASAAKSEGKQAVNVEFLRKAYPMLEERAIDNPTDENVSAYMYAKRIVMDKAQRFSEAVTRVLRKDPVLDENNRVPYASTGALAVRNANYQAQQKAVQEMADTGGLVVFVDSTCRFCAMEMPVLERLKAAYGLEHVVISLDGAKPNGFKGKLLPDNGLFHKLGLKFTPSIVYVPRPKAYKGSEDPNQYLVVSQGFYAEDELVKMIAFAGHSTQLLSTQVMRDLNVWDRGVASSADLKGLKLDPNAPGTFREVLQPYLLKQY